MIVSKNAHKTADSGLTVAYFGLLFSSAVVEIEMVIVSFNTRRWPQPPVLRHTKSMSVKACRSQTNNEWRCKPVGVDNRNHQTLTRWSQCEDIRRTDIAVCRRQ